MKPIPISFQIGPFTLYLYGIGLAITFWFGFRYIEKQLKRYGYESQWLEGAFIWIIIAAIVGARLIHVVANMAFYINSPIQVFEVWNGGLSSFGGLLFGIPTGFYFAKLKCPKLGLVQALDLASPPLMASWALGRLLGPQLMYRGGGLPTHAWYGLRYAGEVGKRFPVPIFQSIECLGIFLVLLALERKFQQRPQGLLIATLLALWGMARFNDEYMWLAKPQLWDAVEVTGIIMAVVGWILIAFLLKNNKKAISSQSNKLTAPID